ncbi:acetyl-CoA carboxylase carboxyl transferase subunit beta [Bacilli bacterium PM5-9]|nr:acetyl-CoA carboxylase carboxyl transferase subunit beta [Bacilli bacterium PM5-9]
MVQMFKNLSSKKEKTRKVKNKIKLKNTRIEVPDDLYRKCPTCSKTINIDEIEGNLYKCPYCNHHFRLRSNERIKIIFDRFEEFNHRPKMYNPLNFPGYSEKIEKLRQEQGINEAVITGYATIGKTKVIGIVMDSYFLMGSMGIAVGEKITRAFETAIRLKYPVVLFSTSGGARMQEGMYSLMQMAKTSGVVERFNDKGGLYINVITDPTTGGVTASFAMLADITLAEPNALIGFAGPRVIEQTINQKLPDDFQKSEFVLEKGFIDKVVDRCDLKETLSQLLRLHGVR